MKIYPIHLKTIFIIFLTIISLQAWTALEQESSEFYGHIGQTQIRVYLQDLFCREGHCHRSLCIYQINGNEHREWQAKLLCGFPESNERSERERFYAKRRIIRVEVSPNMQYFMVQFINKDFLICQLDNTDSYGEGINTVNVLYCSSLHPNITRRAQFPTADTCRVVDQNDRVLFRCNTTTNENVLEVPSTVQPASTSSCSIM